MPNDDMGGVLMDAAKLKHSDTQKTGDCTERASKSDGRERNTAAREQPE